MEINFIDDPKLKLNRAIRKEWLEVNGLGGYASSTLLHCNTRKYHGLLVVTLDKLPDKYVLLSCLDESIVTDGREFFFSTHQYPNTVHPEGYRYLTSFSLLPVAAFTYRINGVLVKKELLMPQGENSVLIRYTVTEGEKPVQLKIKPFLAYRNFHGLSKENPFIRDTVESMDGGFILDPYSEMPRLFTSASREHSFSFQPDWYRNFEYTEEKERGFDYQEDLFTPGVLSTTLTNGQSAIFCFSISKITEALDKKWEKEITRRRNHLPQKDNIRNVLARSAEQFLVKHTGGQKNIVAGYHWFLEWGRDAMIALPGITLCTNRPTDCLEILKTFADYEKDGLIPNFINETTRDAAYNTVDASLWFCWAAQKYLEDTKDFVNIKKLIWPALKNVFLGYSRGTKYNIKMMENGLIYAGDETTQLTWMDAMVGNKPVTPRNGYAVEINALWYNVVLFIQYLAPIFEDKITVNKALPEKIKRSFLEMFWMEEKGCLGDSYDKGKLDPSIRPNQLFAVSMPYSMLSIEQAKRIMHIISKELLTPRGLRTLSPSDPKYRGRYRGNGDARDSAYHNGTVWPWLLGHYGDALLKTAQPEEAQRALESIINNFWDHLKEGGIGSVSEVFDGDSPHTPGGCIAQAWSVAELLRLFTLIDQKQIKN